MSERTAVQDPMLKYAGEIGWEYVPPADALGIPPSAERASDGAQARAPLRGRSAAIAPRPREGRTKR